MDIKNQNVPAPGEEYVMECKLSVEVEVEQPDGEVVRVWEQPVINPIPHKRRIVFEGFATKEVVDKFLSVAERMGGVPSPYIVAPDVPTEQK